MTKTEEMKAEARERYDAVLLAPDVTDHRVRHEAWNLEEKLEEISSAACLKSVRAEISSAFERNLMAMLGDDHVRTAAMLLPGDYPQQRVWEHKGYRMALLPPNPDVRNSGVLNVRTSVPGLGPFENVKIADVDDVFDRFCDEASEAPCGRCGGGGYIPRYDHVQNGRCFACTDR